MKKANFDTLKNLPVPEKWVENALLIPEREKKKAAVIPFWRRKGAIALAASLVLVSVLSVILFSQIGTKPPLKIKSSATESFSPTEVIGDNTADPTPEEATEPKTILDKAKDVIDSIFQTPTETQGSGNTNPTTASDNKKNPPTEPQAQSPTAKPGTRPTESAKPSEALSPPQGEKATETPVSPTFPQRETEEPSPTEAEWYDPTYAPDATEAPWEPPTEAEEKTHLYSVSTSIPKGSMPSDKKVYFRIETADGTVLGDYGMFSAEREMVEYGTGNGSYLFSYDVSRRIPVPVYSSDDFRCFIYDSNGNILTTKYHLFYN